MGDNESSLVSTANDHSSISSMDEDVASECSMELGLDYPRIEYSQEEYDRVCGNVRVKRKPLAKKKKVEECLSDSQSSQAASEKARSRKKNKKKAVGKVSGTKKGGVTRKRKIVKKVVRRRSAKKDDVNYKEDGTTDDDSEYETESAGGSEDSEEAPSSPVKKKKRESSPKATSSRSASEKYADKKRKKEERRIEEIRRLMEQKWRRQEERKEEEKKEREKEKKRKEKEERKKEEKRKEKEAKEEKEAEAKRDKAKPDREGKSSKDRAREEEKAEEERRKRKAEKRRMKELRRQMEERARQKREAEERLEQKYEALLAKPKSEAEAKKGSPESKKSIAEGKTSDSSQEVPPKHAAGIRPAIPVSSQSSSVPGQPKSILKKPGASRAIPTGLTATPLKTVVSVDRALVDRPRFDDTFRVPKKTTQARVDEPKTPSKGFTSTTPASAERSETSADDDGWDPKDDARVPPPRVFKKTPVHDLVQKPGEAVMRPQGTPAKLDRPDPRAGGANATQLGRFQSFPSSSFATPVKTPATSRETSSNERREGFALVKRAVERKAPPTTASFWTPVAPAPQHQRQPPLSPSPSSERERSATRWDEYTPPPQARGGSPMANTPQSPPRSASSSQSQQSTSSFSSLNHHLAMILGGGAMTPASPVLIPTEQRCGAAVRWKFIPIDDDCLPPWRKHNVTVPSPASPVQRCRGLVVAGPFDASINKAVFETMMKSRGADVEWMTAPPTDDVAAQAQRSLAAIVCYEEATAKELLGTATMKVERAFVSFGEPKEVLAAARGFPPGDTVDETKLIMEMTDVIETYYGHLVELLVLSPVVTAEGDVQCKARFFHEYHASRAENGAPLPLAITGRTIAFSACPPERKTTWVAEVASEAEEQARRGAAAQPPQMPAPVPPPAFMAPMGQPVPAPGPSVPPVSMVLLKRELSATAVNIPLVWERSESEEAISTQHARTENRAAGGGGGGASRFSALPSVPIAPPGLMDHAELRRILNKVKEEVRSVAPFTPPAPVSSNRRVLLPTPSLPPCIPTALIPLPPGGGPIPVLPYPAIPQLDHHFFRTPVKVERAASGADRGGGAAMRSGGGVPSGGPALLTVDPATFIRPFGALLPPHEEGEVLLFARPMAATLPAHWDAVREHFKDNDCSSRVYGGMVSLRFTGAKAKEKAQLLLLNSPHTINGEQFAIGMTYTVLCEASKAVGKTRLYDEVMQRPNPQLATASQWAISR